MPLRQENYSVAELLSLLPGATREKLLKSLTPDQEKAALHDWRGFWARPNQIQPQGNWLLWLVLAGRGFGKTRTGAETVREWARKPLPAPIHLVAPTAGDIRRVMIEGPSGLLSCYPPGQRPMYEPSNGHKVTWANGNVAFGFSADEPERLRGPQCSRFWADEIAGWRGAATKKREDSGPAKSRAEETWDNLMFGFRIGDELRGVITTTPKPTKLIKDLAKNPDAVVTKGSTYDNRLNLASGFFQQVVKKYEGTRLGRQELLAEILEDTPGALWTQDRIDRAKWDNFAKDEVVRMVVAIDPAVSTSEESADTGIVVAALLRSGHVAVIDDLTCHETPLGWARVAISAFKEWHADRIVGEINNGGDLVEANIRAVDANIPFRAVRAKRGKAIRAEPVAALYEQGRVHHVGSFPDLETQMTTFVPGMERTAEQRLDRMDALVWAITELVVDVEQVPRTIPWSVPVRISRY